MSHPVPSSAAVPAVPGLQHAHLLMSAGSAAAPTAAAGQPAPLLLCVALRILSANTVRLTTTNPHLQVHKRGIYGSMGQLQAIQ